MEYLSDHPSDSEDSCTESDDTSSEGGGAKEDLASSLRVSNEVLVGVALHGDSVGLDLVTCTVATDVSVEAIAVAGLVPPGSGRWERGKGCETVLLFKFGFDDLSKAFFCCCCFGGDSFLSFLLGPDCLITLTFLFLGDSLAVVLPPFDTFFKSILESGYGAFNLLSSDFRIIPLFISLERVFDS